MLIGPPRSFAAATLPCWSGLSFQIVCSYSGCFGSSSAVSGAIVVDAQMLDAKCRTGNGTLVSVHDQEPSDEDATNVAQPRYTTLASSICDYRCSAVGDSYTLGGTHKLCRVEKGTKSDCCGDEVKIELFNACLPWIEAEARMMCTRGTPQLHLARTTDDSRQ